MVEVKAVEEDEAAEDEVEILEITMDQYYNYKIQWDYKGYLLLCPKGRVGVVKDVSIIYIIVLLTSYVL